jgi:hypothetical protein
MPLTFVRGRKHPSPVRRRRGHAAPLALLLAPVGPPAVGKEDDAEEIRWGSAAQPDTGSWPSGYGMTRGPAAVDAAGWTKSQSAGRALPLSPPTRPPPPQELSSNSAAAARGG